MIYVLALGLKVIPVDLYICEHAEAPCSSLACSISLRPNSLCAAPSEGLLPGWQQEVFLKETLTFILFYLFIYLLCPHEARAGCPGLVWSPHRARSRPAPGRLQGPGRTAGGSTAQRTATSAAAKKETQTFIFRLHVLK